MMMMMMMGGNNQFAAQNEGGGPLGNNRMNNDSVGVGVGREGEIVLKKGPWTAAEDAVLAGYVRRHGEGNWNAVRKNTGLARCGKSCRLRWANHLRPNLKKGSFSPEEERIIIELHAKMGNRWARMATQLPGRTDNEIKNYWNTRVKRRQRQGLPLYPPDVQPHYSQHRQRQSHPPSPIPSPPPTTEPNSCFSFQTPIVSPHTSNPMPLHPLNIPHRPPPQNFLYNPHSALTTPPPPLQSPNSASTPPPLPSPNASTPPHISPLYSPHNPPPFPTLPLFDYPNITTDDDFFHSNKRFKHDGLQSNNYNNNHLDATSSSFTLPFSPMQHYSNGMTLDLPLSSRTAFNHHPHQDSGGFYPLKTDLRSNQINDDGLLENILQEARALAANGRGGNKEMPKEMMNSAENEEEDYSRLINIDGLSSLGMAIPEWCNDSGESSERQPSVITDNENHLALDMHQIASLYPDDISPNHAARSSSVQSWDKFPGLC